MEVRALLSTATLHAAVAPVIPAPPVKLSVVATSTNLDLLQPDTFAILIDTSSFQYKDVSNTIEEKNFYGKWVAVGSGPSRVYTVTQRLGGDVQFRVKAQLIIDTDPDRDKKGEKESPEDDDDAKVNAVSAPITVHVNYPSCDQIIANPKVNFFANVAWKAEQTITFLNQGPRAANGSYPQSRRAEVGYWIQYNTATGTYLHTGLTLGAFNAPDQGAGVILGPRPADIPSADGLSAIYTVASFHTHTPTTYRSPFRVGRNLIDRRPVGPSGADDRADKADNVAGLVYDYIATPRTPGAIPFRWPLGSPAKIYCSTSPTGGMNRRR